jgi:hypothetical protein
MSKFRIVLQKRDFHYTDCRDSRLVWVIIYYYYFVREGVCAKQSKLLKKPETNRFKDTEYVDISYRKFSNYCTVHSLWIFSNFIFYPIWLNWISSKAKLKSRVLTINRTDNRNHNNNENFFNSTNNLCNNSCKKSSDKKRYACNEITLCVREKRKSNEFSVSAEFTLRVLRVLQVTTAYYNYRKRNSNFLHGLLVSIQVLISTVLVSKFKLIFGQISLLNLPHILTVLLPLISDFLYYFSEVS